MVWTAAPTADARQGDAVQVEGAGGQFRADGLEGPRPPC